ncbi:uncharacterized protein LOC114973897 [Acropora millepora]|uniref:uncharacterized protein LOC114973897 n=1 Tax=Acropora millepora TaxID=45264 RepID=UPI001CF13BF2|nr:uncharacterized protein LOC114973897 [Acropora millepora]
MWTQEKLPQDLKDASIIHLYKRKGNRNSCDNHRGISLLSIAGKILASILLNHLNVHLERDLLPESQCGFHAGPGTADMIFAARQLQEKCQEQNVGLCTTFVDLTKAFDTVCCEGLWKIMAKFGCPAKFIAMVQQFHDGMNARVQDDREYSEPFPVTNGVKQGCLSPYPLQHDVLGHADRRFPRWRRRGLLPTEVLHQPAPATLYVEPNIRVNGQKLAVTDKFVYLGSTLSRSVNIDEEVSYRIARASAAFGRLRDTVWERRGLTKETKLKVYQAVVLPSLLYACETWTTYSRHIKQLNAFHMRCLRSLLHIKWQDKVPDTEVLQRAEMEGIHAILLRHQLRWAGHVHRMDDCRLPKRLFYGELSTGKRTTGRPKKRYKDTLKEVLKLCTIPQAT